MSRISWFRGIAIYLNENDHAPPHVHAYYAEHQAVVRVSDAVVSRGSLPPRQERLVQAWVVARRHQILECWARAQRHETPGTVEPL